ncbi:MAG: hypothetical protein WCO37_02940 [Bacteroidota bacterium]
MRILNPFLFFILFLFFIPIENSFSQAQFKNFTEEEEPFAKEIKDFLKTSNRDLANLFIDDWLKTYWDLKKGTDFNQEQRNFIYKTCNWMLKKRVKAFPEFQAFLVSMSKFSEGVLDDKNYQLWVKSLEKVMTAKTLTPFTNFVTMSENLFTTNTIYKSVTTEWQASTKNFTFEYDSIPKVIFQKTNIKCYSIQDSLVIYDTEGYYEVIAQKWTGFKGKVDWQRANMDPKIVYALLEDYKIDFKTTTYTADSVSYINPKYFNHPLIGKLTDKVLNGSNGEKAIYPTFDSYDKRYSIKDIYPDVDFDGGFLVKGAKFIGSGTLENPATLRFKLKGNTFLKVTSLSLTLRDDRVASERAGVVFYWEKDSMYHPGLPIKYLVKNREVSMLRDNSGIARSPFFDTYHKLELDFEQLIWKLDEPKIDLRMIIGSSESNAKFESFNYFRDYKFAKLQGMDDVNPLFRIKSFSKEKNVKTVEIIDLSKYFKTAPSQMRPLLLKMAMEGFVNYNEESDKVEVKEKTFDHCLYKLGKKDYDVLEFKSTLFSDQANASINLLNFDLKIFGVEKIFLSDSQNVSIRPSGKTILVKKNRDFFFAGVINAGRFTFFGKEFSFEYDKFKINLTNTDSLRIKVLSKEMDENGMPKLVNVKTVIENIQGELLIDNPNNKSGVVNFAQYPILISKSDSYSYWDQKSVQGGVYKRDRTFFHLEPFTIDSLDNFDNAALSFNGEFESAGVFPTIKEKLVLQQDYSLGINYQTPASGLPMYQDKGKFISKINMSNRGLRGDGELQYVTSTFNSNDLLFFPDSTNGDVQKFEEKPQKDPTQFPVARSTDTYIHWMPYKDFMNIHERSVPIKMYDGIADFHGMLTLSPQRLIGKGNAEFFKANLESNKMVFQERMFDADTCNFNLKNLADSSGLAFLSTNLKAHIDFDQRIGDFTSNGGGSFIKFPVNQYLCFMDNFKWYMEKDNLELSSSEEGSKRTLSSTDDLDLTGAEFISTHPEQDSLRFLSPKAKYDLRTNIIKCADVRYINTGDARVYPDSGKVVIYKKAKLEDLKNASILANTTTKYHTLFNANVEILGRKKYTGFADYRYRDVTDNEQLVHFDVVGTDITGQTVGEGVIKEEANFTLSPAFEYKGILRLQASSQNLFFKGNFRLVHACDKIKKSWVFFDADINPTDVYIPLDTARIFDIDNKTVGSGMMIATDSMHVYSSFMSTKRQGADLVLMESRGFIYYDDTYKEYKIASKDKIKQISFPGNYMSLNTQDCKIYGEGNLSMVKNMGQVNLQTFGSLEHNLNNDSITFETVMAIDFFFENSLIKQISELLEKSTNAEPVPFTRPIYERSLTELVGKKEADKLISQVNLYGAFKKIPDELEHTIFFSDVKFKWNPSTKSFVSQGKVGIGNIFKNQLNRYYPCKIELVPKRSGDVVNIYLADENNNWYFFSYTINQMQAISSDEKWNTAIKELKPEKRQKEKEKGQASYIFNLGIASKAKSFLKKFEE